MIEKHVIRMCELLDRLGSFGTRLDLIREIIQAPDFCYESSPYSEMLTNRFMASSYWLDRELFDESYLYQKKTQGLFPMQKAHLEMLDIGGELLDKGFPLVYRPEKYTEKGPHHLAGYVKTFVEQCHKRHAFLKEQSVFPLYKKCAIKFVSDALNR